MIRVPSRLPSLPLELPKADIPVEPMQVHMLSYLTLIAGKPPSADAEAGELTQRYGKSWKWMWSFLRDILASHDDALDPRKTRVRLSPNA